MLMIKIFLTRLLVKNKALIIQESHYIHDFMQVLMKPRNTGVKWNREEINQLKSHFKHLSLYLPVLIIFVMPFGAILLPMIAEVLDRRKERRPH